MSSEAKLHYALGHSWYTKLKGLFTTPEIEEVYRKYAELIEHPTYPKADNMFRAFRLSAFEDTKVVIINPFPLTSDASDGLAFSSQDPFDVSSSLKEILAEVERTTKEHYPHQADLTRWATQGVLLLNLELSVTLLKTNETSFMFETPGWDFVTKQALRLLLEDQVPRVFLMWGKRNQYSIEELSEGLDVSHHLFMTAPYPGTEPEDGTTFLGCEHFTKTNEFINNLYNIKINW